MKKIIIILFSLFGFLSYSQSCPFPNSVIPTPNVTSVFISWNPIPGVSGYNVTVVGIGTIFATAGQTVTSFGGLTPNTVYSYSVTTVCPSGNSFPFTGSFRTLDSGAGDCPFNRVITETATAGQFNFLSAQNTISASNIILTNINAEYDAGERVRLLPGFHARSGSIFKAFIEGCTPQGRSMRISTKGDNEILTDNSTFIYPNPTTNTINIESNKDINTIEIFNQIGMVKSKNKLSILNKKSSFDISNYSTGFYIVRITFKDGSFLNKKIIKK
ncbi:3-coathanger stack domain-containing protein [uncultured Tenacibaculum sp.]|uniref:T9SS type A sorting domain-containing protein n=1 Tax=uncultured Tenacibaculum sp. TaxID=174713 RepID=UPI00261FA70D|nr:3-coathanger stack domain-containing protein [uncultured Tenacibaculum sp.]